MGDGGWGMGDGGWGMGVGLDGAGRDGTGRLCASHHSHITVITAPAAQRTLGNKPIQSHDKTTKAQMCQPPLTHSHRNGTNRSKEPWKQANPRFTCANSPPMCQPPLTHNHPAQTTTTTSPSKQANPHTTHTPTNPPKAQMCQPPLTHNRAAGTLKHQQPRKQPLLHPTANPTHRPPHNVSATTHT